MTFCGRHSYDGLFACPGCNVEVRRAAAGRVVYCRFRLREIGTGREDADRAYAEAMAIEDVNELLAWRDDLQRRLDEHELLNPTPGARMRSALERAGFKTERGT